METKQTPARDVQKGQQLTAVPNEKLRRRNGTWPTVTSRAFLEDGEGGQPTVYIETHEMPGWTYCLYPDDVVTVLVSDEPEKPRGRSPYLLHHILAALAFLACGSAAATATNPIVRVVFAVLAVALPVANEVSVWLRKRARARAGDPQ